MGYKTSQKLDASEIEFEELSDSNLDNIAGGCPSKDQQENAPVKDPNDEIFQRIVGVPMGKRARPQQAQLNKSKCNK